MCSQRPWAQIFIVLAVIAALMLGVVALRLRVATVEQPRQGVESPQASPSEEVFQTASLSASWATKERDIASLKGASHVVVAGKISAVSGVTSRTAPTGTGASGLVFTDFTFQVSQVLSDPRGRVSGTSVIVHQTGGIVGSTRYQVDDDPLFQVGDEAVLFLTEYEPGRFFVRGGPNGRFAIRAGQVYPADRDGVTLPATLSSQAFYDLVKNTPAR